MTEEYGFAIYYASYHELDRDKDRHPYQFSDIGEEWNEPLTEELIEKYYKKLPDWAIEDLVHKTEIEDRLYRYMHQWNEQIFADDIFRLLNYYPTNPLAPEFHQAHSGVLDRKGQDWLEENAVHHTSMSVGDLVMIEKSVDSTDGPVTVKHFLYCQNTGWNEFDLI